MPQALRALVAVVPVAVGLAVAGCGSSNSAPAGESPTAAPAPSASSTPPPSGTAATPTGGAPSRPTGPLGGGPVNQWTWYDVPESACGNGTPTGLGVSIGTGDDLVVFMMGGGACFDEVTCAGSQAAGIPLALYVMDGFRQDDFEKLIAGHGKIPLPPTGTLFDRTLATNPYRNASFVVIPYCTGDLHLGTKTQQWNGATKMLMHYSGLTNLDAFLGKIAPSFPNPSRVTLIGASAGAFGATVHYERIKRALGASRLDLVADSGPWFHPSSMPAIEVGMNDVWVGKEAIPDGCTDCKSDISKIYEYDSKIGANARFAFLSHDQDGTISLSDLMPGYPTFYFAIKDLTLNTIKPLTNWRYFVGAGSVHTFVTNLGETSASQWTHECDQTLFGFCIKGHNTAVDPTTLGTWLTAMATDDPSWSSLTSITQ